MTQSDYSRRFDAAVAEMDAAGIWRSNGLPPYLKLGRKLGLEPRPPYYLPFAKVVVLLGLYFGLGWGFMMSLIIWRQQAIPLYFQFIVAALAGLSFGLVMASWYHHVRKKRRLSSWQDL